MNDETPKDAQTEWEEAQPPETDEAEIRTDEVTEEPAAEGESEEPPTDWEALARSRYEQLLRLQADFENFRRRMERERRDLQGQVAERLLGDLLPVFDNLERALKYMPNEGEAKNWRVGVEMTLNGFLDALGRLGVAPIVAVGASFDPRFHEAVEQVPSGEPEGTVVEELKRGFTWNDRVLRASLVKVSTGEQ
jgi:molecular chaperone GrpE